MCISAYSYNHICVQIYLDKSLKAILISDKINFKLRTVTRDKRTILHNDQGINPETMVLNKYQVKLPPWNKGLSQTIYNYFSGFFSNCIYKCPSVWTGVKHHTWVQLFKIVAKYTYHFNHFKVCNSLVLGAFIVLRNHSVQFSSVAQSCLTLCDPMNRNTAGLPV